MPKFRAWDTTKKEMFKDTFAITESGQVVVVEQDFITNAPDYIFVDHLTIMQSTGLCDKNGKEIFEGDILKVTDTFDETEGSIEVVFYSQGQALFATKDIDKNIYKLCNTLMFDVEIIGNIYEDSELLN